MLAAVGYSGAEALIDAAVPAAIRTARPLELPPALSSPPRWTGSGSWRPATPC